MSKADMKCGNCSNVWEYSGLALYSCYCPLCGAKNELPRNAEEVHEYFGFK